MRRALLVLGLALGLGLVVRRFRHDLAAVFKLPAWLVVLSWSGLFAPWDWIWDRVTSIADDIRRWVLGVVNDVYRWAQDGLNWLWGALGDLGRWVGGALDALSNFVQALWRDLVGWVERGLDAIGRFVGQLWHDVTQWVTALFHDITRWVGDLLRDVWGWIEGLPKWLWDNIVTPLWNSIQWVWHEVVEPAIRWVGDQLGHLWDFVWGALKAVWHEVARAWDWIDRWATRLLRVVEKCYDWLVKLAEHGPGWVIDQVQAMFRRAPQWLAHEIEHTMATEGDTVERFFADWIG